MDPFRTQLAELCRVERTQVLAAVRCRAWAGGGYSMEHDMQTVFRDSRVGPIGGGSNEVQRNIIARLMGLPA